MRSISIKNYLNLRSANKHLTSRETFHSTIRGINLFENKVRYSINKTVEGEKNEQNYVITNTSVFGYTLMTY